MTKKKPEIVIDQILLNQRELFLYDSVTQESAQKLIKEIIVLDSKKHAPINLWINSPGGNVTAGLAIINIMKSVKSKITTIVNSEACSMASQISIVGDKRIITANGFWMAHDMSGGITGDYLGKVKYRAKYLEKLFDVLEEDYKKYTKLTKKDLEIARNGELWLNAEQCLEKGIVDKILK